MLRRTQRLVGGSGESLAPGTIAAIGGVPGHFGVAAGGTDEPFSVGTGGHFLKGITVGAVGAANHFCGGLARTAHSGDEGEARIVDGTALLVHRRGVGGQGLSTDGAVRHFCIHIPRPGATR